jgi:hypothetical protein
MSWINTGARVNGARPRTKAALKRALEHEPEAVTFDVTSALGPRGSEVITPATIGTSTLSVCGPDPYATRTWYATVAISGRTGKVTLT